MEPNIHYFDREGILNYNLSFTILGCGSSGGVPLIGNIWGPCDPKNPKKRVDSPFARTNFKTEKIRFDLASFQLERSDEERYSNVAQFMNLKQLQQNIDSINKNIKEKFNDHFSEKPGK